MARIVALGGDGHTALSLTQAAANFHTYPIQLYWFKEGIYATAVLPEAGVPALGKRLVRIGNTSIDDAVDSHRILDRQLSLIAMSEFARRTDSPAAA